MSMPSNNFKIYLLFKLQTLQAFQFTTKVLAELVTKAWAQCVLDRLGSILGDAIY